MVRALLIVLLTACGGGEDNPSAGGGGAVATSEAGKVRELTGKVTATRGTEVRTLAVGTPVTGEDMIDTGADGSVVIELSHNHALWSLESGIKARVDQSVAWGLPKQDAAKPVEHATSSAGRHADREAANTAVSAEMAKDPAPASTEPARPTTPTTTPPPPPKPPRPTSEPKPTGGGDGGACDEVSCMLNNGASPCCAKFKKGRTGRPAEPPEPGASDLPESLGRVEIQTAMNQIKPRLLACGKPVSASGTLKITVRVGGDGKVISVDVKQSPDPAIDACVIDTMKKQPFGKSRNGASFSYPILF